MNEYPYYNIDPRHIVKVCSDEEAEEMERKWKEVYCINDKGIRIKDYKWHIFCGKRYPAMEGGIAEREYSHHVAQNYVILNEDNYCILADEKPTNCNGLDLYVFPENLAWTMTFSHEEGYIGGPYFAKHPNYSVLNSQNKQKIAKLKEIENAKSKGWM